MSGDIVGVCNVAGECVADIRSVTVSGECGTLINVHDSIRFSTILNFDLLYSRFIDLDAFIIFAFRKQTMQTFRSNLWARSIWG